MNNESPKENTRLESLKGNLVISRIVYKTANAIKGGIILLSLILATKGIFWVADWGDAAFALIVIGLYLLARKIERFLIGIWGVRILAAKQEDAFVMLQAAQESLIRRGW